MTKACKFSSKLMVFLYSALLLVIPGVVFGQITNVTNDQSRPIPGAGHDYIKLFSETVNPATGVCTPIPQ